MKRSKKAENLLRDIGQIQKMERGKLCQMKGREHFNHQEWRAGRNIVRYIPQEEIKHVQQAIDEHAKFMTLIGQYVDEIVRITREDRKKANSKPQKSSSANANKSKSKI